jgi:PAS domain S-box-containing protein
VRELVDTLEGAADGAFIVDEDLEIVYANSSVERILGFDLEEFVESYCYQVLNGRDEEQRLICIQHCAIAQRVISDHPVTDFDLNVTAPEERRWINMSVLQYTDIQQEVSYIVHLFRDVTQQKNEVLLIERLVDVAKNYHNIQLNSSNRQDLSHRVEELTAREGEVLERLAEGSSTREISQQLSISINTTRNHIQNILQKLGVHSRLEAVIYAIDHDLVNHDD